MLLTLVSAITEGSLSGSCSQSTLSSATRGSRYRNWDESFYNISYNKYAFKEERLAPVKFVAGLKESLAMVREVIFSLQYNYEESNEDLMRNAAIEAEKKLVEAIKVFRSMF
jgi:hypothetical protein